MIFRFFFIPVSSSWLPEGILAENRRRGKRQGAIRRLRAPPEANSRTGAPAAGTPPGGGDERRSTSHKILRLTATATERPATARFSSSWPGRSAPTQGGG